MAHDIATEGQRHSQLPTQQSTTKNVTDVDWTALRTNVNGTKTLVGTVTYDDTSTATVEVPVLSAK